ncbi:hypothetical protein F3K43_09820 [Streptomyces sp. LBUM 1476]|nr:hypothetical protein [Streptomyces sp. LBUM 1476]
MRLYSTSTDLPTTLSADGVVARAPPAPCRRPDAGGPPRTAPPPPGAVRLADPVAHGSMPPGPLRAARLPCG